MTANPPIHHSLVTWWRHHVLGTVEYDEVLVRIRDDSGWSGRYLLMLLLSAGIALLGLLLSSVAVVIGAMLISPLMGPIIGLGFGIATFDSREIRRSAVALAGGAFLAVLFCALLVLVSPLQNVTSEIAARTRPNLFDLVIALLSAIAGAYATIRGRAGTVVGVAIATALMPPLAVVGFGLATRNGTVFGGALLLFFTNFMTIALTAAAMARLYSFGPRLSPRQTVVQTIVLLALFAALAVPLGVALRQVAWEAVSTRQARDVLNAEFGDEARVAQVEPQFDGTPVRLTATVFTPQYRSGADAHVAAALQRLIGRPVDVSIEQIRVGHGDADAQASGVAAQAQQPAQAGTTQAADRLAERIALIAGVAPDAVLIDASSRRARVTAAILPGATLATYHALEQRVAASSPDWTIEMVPPLAAALGTVEFDGDAPDAAGRSAIADAIWGASQLGLAVTVAGDPTRARTVVETLSEHAITATAAAGRRGASVTLAWSVPEASATPTPSPAG